MKYFGIALYTLMVVGMVVPCAIIADATGHIAAGHVASGLVGFSGGWMLKSVWRWLKVVLQ